MSNVKLQERSVSKRRVQGDSTRRMKVGAVIILASIAAFFAWGFAFDLFGHRILLNLQTAGFFGWIAVGMFGVGYVYGGPRGGLRTAGGFAVLAMAAVALGIARGAYR